MAKAIDTQPTTESQGAVLPGPEARRPLPDHEGELEVLVGVREVQRVPRWPEGGEGDSRPPDIG
jgi:hypothetical protein